MYLVTFKKIREKGLWKSENLNDPLEYHLKVSLTDYWVSNVSFKKKNSSKIDTAECWSNISCLFSHLAHLSLNSKIIWFTKHNKQMKIWISDSNVWVLLGDCLIVTSHAFFSKLEFALIWKDINETCKESSTIPEKRRQIWDLIICQRLNVFLSFWKRSCIESDLNWSSFCHVFKIYWVCLKFQLVPNLFFGFKVELPFFFIICHFFIIIFTNTKTNRIY